MSDFGGNRLQKIGLLLSALNPQSLQNTMGLAQADQEMRRQRRFDDADTAADQYMRLQGQGALKVQPAGLSSNMGADGTPITWNQERPAIEDQYVKSLMVRMYGGPAAYFRNEMATAAANAKPMVLAKDAIATDQTGKVLASNIQPDAPNELLNPDVFDAKVRLANATRAPASNDETWNNPVPEVGPDGRPIQVRYSNKGNRQVIEGATPSKQGNSFDRADYWRSQVKPFADSATNARVQSSKVGASLALGTGTGHIAAINALQKMIDEGAVVRDQDVALIQSAQSLAGRLGAQMETLKSGKILSPELQEELKGVAGSLENAIYQGVNERIGAYEPVMSEEGVKMDSVLPPAMRKMFTAKPTASPAAKPPGPPPIGKNGRPMVWVSK